MKMKKRFFAILLSAVLCFSLCVFSACKSDSGQGEVKEEKHDPIASYKYTYKSLGDKVFPIGAWMAPPYENDITPIPGTYITDAAYKDIADSGINCIYSLYDRADNTAPITSVKNQHVMNALKYATKYNICYLTRDWNEMALMDEDDAERMATGVYAEFKKSPAFEGIMVIDEPGFAHFENMTAMKKNFDKFFKDDLFYVNMMPTYASERQLKFGAASEGGDASTIELYSEYVETYIRDIKPQVFSYDFYPMMGKFPSISKGYFENMSIVRKNTASAKIPFWTFIQNTSWGSSVRISNQAEVDWQVNTSLAYGAKGIQYFSYWTPFDDSGSHPGYYPSSSAEKIGSMVSPTGEKQDMYYRVQNTNKTLKVVGNKLLDAGFGGIIQVGESPDEIPSQDKITDFRELTGATGDNAIIGCFDKGGKTMYYVVNNSLTKENATITLNFKKEYSFKVTSGRDSTEKDEKANSATIKLAPGCGALIEIL